MRIVVVLAVAAGVTACSSEVPAADAIGEGPAVVVPVGPVPAHALAAARRRLEQMGFPATIGRPMGIAPESVDPGRRQLIGDVLLDRAVAAAAPAGAEVAPMVVAVTAKDIYMTGRPEWGFVFSVRNRDGSGAILSTARMDPVNFGLPADAKAIDRRLETMLVRVVGITRLGASMVSDPTCANRESVLSLDDLDQMRPVLCNPA